MKKKYVYSSLLFLFVIVSVFLFAGLKRKQNHLKNEKMAYSPLLPRKASLAYAAEWPVIKSNAGILLGKIEKDASDIKSLMDLTALYLQEARITGQFDYYNNAALQCIDKVLADDTGNFEALSFKTTILLSQHHFEKARVLAEKIQGLYPYNAYVYGLLVDAYVESGLYTRALEAADRMISIRPDIRSYSRIAYLREIHGDIPGAIEAMQLAVDAGVPGDETTEWCRVQAGKLNEKLGRLKEAKMLYTIARNNRTDYPYALAGLARIAITEKEFSKALDLYRHADSLIPDHTFKEGISEVYNLQGQTEKSKEIAQQTLAYMKQFSSAAKKNRDAGQNEDHEMSHAYLGVGNYDSALEYALKEYRKRPGNIEVNETVAIVYYAKGEYEKAIPFIKAALKTNCKNPELLCHAGMIYAKSGKQNEAKVFLNNALKSNPCITPELERESRQMLGMLQNHI